MNHFIELELAPEAARGQTVEISPMFIESMKRIDFNGTSFTVIRMFSGAQHDVKETSKEIKKLANTKKITYFNQGQ